VTWPASGGLQCNLSVFTIVITERHAAISVVINRRQVAFHMLLATVVMGTDRATLRRQSLNHFPEVVR